eukprot:COSAG02_NODE_59220_length_275_cov_0.568182_1_plen_63_part_10
MLVSAACQLHLSPFESIFCRRSRTSRLIARYVRMTAQTLTAMGIRIHAIRTTQTARSTQLVLP